MTIQLSALLFSMLAKAALICLPLVAKRGANIPGHVVLCLGRKDLKKKKVNPGPYHSKYEVQLLQLT